MQNQAALIVKYPTEIELDNNIYYYLILWADKDHIEQIGQSLTFIDESSEWTSFPRLQILKCGIISKEGCERSNERYIYCSQWKY